MLRDGALRKTTSLASDFFTVVELQLGVARGPGVGTNVRDVVFMALRNALIKLCASVLRDLHVVDRINYQFLVGVVTT